MRTWKHRMTAAWATVMIGAGAAVVGAPAALAVPPAAVAGVTVTDMTPVTARTVQLTISTPAFDRPELVEVTLPVGYGADTTRRWPVTYYLHGTNHDQTTFRAYGGEELTTAYPSLVVAPDGDAGYWSDWYAALPGHPRDYETFVVDQLIPLIDATFRTLPDRAHRLIMGESMGGWGVLMTTARHPDLFAAAASLSGVLDSSSPLAAAGIAASSVLSGGLPDAIYGPYTTQQARWRGHDPVELADNLRGVDLQVFTGNGVYDPAHGETPVEGAACPVLEGLVIHPTSVSMHERLLALGIPHRWVDLDWGCHGVAEFHHEIGLAVDHFRDVLAHPAAAPSPISYRSVEPAFRVWDWSVRADPRRAPEFLALQDANEHGVVVTGSGTTTISTPPSFAGARTVDVTVDGRTRTVTPTAAGRLIFVVDLGNPTPVQQFALGYAGAVKRAVVTFAPVR